MYLYHTNFFTIQIHLNPRVLEPERFDPLFVLVSLVADATRKDSGFFLFLKKARILSSYGWLSSEIIRIGDYAVNK
jgi:hypothetical protein